MNETGKHETWTWMSEAARRMENSAYPRDVLPGLPHIGKCPTHFYGSSWMCRVCVNLEIPQNCDVFFTCKNTQKRRAVAFPWIFAGWKTFGTDPKSPPCDPLKNCRFQFSVALGSTSICLMTCKAFCQCQRPSALITVFRVILGRWCGKPLMGYQDGILMFTYP